MCLDPQLMSFMLLAIWTGDHWSSKFPVPNAPNSPLPHVNNNPFEVIAAVDDQPQDSFIAE